MDIITIGKGGGHMGCESNMLSKLSGITVVLSTSCISVMVSFESLSGLYYYLGEGGCLIERESCNHRHLKPFIIFNIMHQEVNNIF